jgi:hypothetical protein
LNHLVDSLDGYTFFQTEKDVGLKNETADELVGWFEEQDRLLLFCYLNHLA